MPSFTSLLEGVPALVFSLFVIVSMVGCGPSDDVSPVETEPGEDTATTDETNSEPPQACLEEPEGDVSLPEDDGVHGEPLEWWYWTGHLQTEDGRWFGFEQVFFLIETNMGVAVMGHHALTDVAGQSFEYDVKFGLYNGVNPDGGFNFQVAPLSAQGGGGNDTLHGELANSTLDLSLRSAKKPVFQHGNGYHDYPFGGYTYYYSRERMTATGTLVLDGEEMAVTGTAWFDHQWGELGDATDAGWDWFAIQLDDSREVMATIIHDATGPLMAAGSITDAQCNTLDLAEDEVVITPVGEWTSPTTGCVYPMGWDVSAGDLNLRVTPVMDDQELTSPEKTYWEGAATVSGDATGRAYIELVGYWP